MYRDFIRSGELILTINGEVIEFINPNWLIAPYWTTDKGPQSSSDLKWTKEFEFTLDESFQESPNLDVPPVIRGKVGILDKGDTKRAGLSLIWRRKVVQGAGNLADSPDDLYRPAMIYGGSNSFERQRIIGEIDVSDLKVTSFKDSVVWQEDQEEELLKKLKEVLSADDLPILKMARNYRARTVSEQQNYIAKEALADVTARMATSLQNSLQKSDLDSNFVSTRDLHETEPSSEFEKAFTSELRLIPRFNSDVILELRFNSNDPEWLRVCPAESRKSWQIIVNGSHPFMESFTSANPDSLEPVLRLALAIAIAEIQGISSGFESSQFLRLCINDLLKNELSSRSELEELESKNE
jgi:hypothetical protein